MTGGNPVNVVAPYKMTIAGTPSAAGSTSCTVTAWDGLNGSGGNSAKITVTFSIASGAVATAPSITTQPSSQTVNMGSAVSFTVAASGSPAPTFQWQKNGSAISGATSATLALSNVQAADAGSYTAVATNSAGSATSSAATLTVQAAAVAPSITTQPSSQTVTAGAAVSFTVAASGTPTPTLQWLKNGAVIAGATSGTLALSNVQAADAGSYTAVATNSAGTATSSAAVLTVQAAAVAPAFTTQPTNQTVTAGSAVSFTVAASGTPAPTYQWQKNGAAIAGATSPTLSLSNVQAADAGSYTAVATNSAGTATSSAATLTVQAAPPPNTAPTITTQPSSQSATVGGAVIFTFSASGNPAPTYQWRKDGAAVAGATGATLSLGSVQLTDAGSYTVVVSNSAGTVTSSAATLTVQAAAVAPSITTQPTSQVVTAGASVTFTVAASGSPPPTFQWRKNGANLAGATGAAFTIAAAATGDAGTYTVLVSNSAGSVVSAAATLVVGTPATGGPAITANLPAQTVVTGHNLSFSAQSLTGTYQWQLSTDGGSSWANVANGGAYSGATSSTLTISGATSAMNGALYRYIVTDSNGSSTSNAAQLTVASAIFPNPAGIVFLAGGTLYASDATADTVQKITLTGDVSVVAGTSGAAGSTDAAGALALFNQPGGLVVNASGVLFVADTANATIRRIGADGVVSTFAGSATARGSTNGPGLQATFSAPQGLALDAAGNLYVADAGAHTIRLISPAGVVTTFAGTAGVSGAVDGPGASARFNTPSGVAVDAAGNVYVADRSNNVIRKITPAGVVSTLAGLAGVSGADDGTASGALFNQPSGLVLDGAGNLFVADTGNSTIRMITPTGIVSTLAGLPTVSGDEDGTGSGALFNLPRALTIDAAGNLYVADTGNAAIRKVTPAGVVTTLTLQQVAATPPSGGGSSTSGNTGTTAATGTGTTSSGPRETGAGAMDGAFAAAIGLLVLVRAWRRAASTPASS